MKSTIKRWLRRTLNTLLSPLGYVVLNRREVARHQAVLQALERIIVNDRLSNRTVDKSGNLAHGVIFSRDRAMQLYSLLSSYFEHVVNPAPLTVLYRVSDMRHESAYQQLASLFASRPVKFIREEGFCYDLRRIVGSLSTSTVFFLVDDIIVVEPFDMNDFADVDTDRFVPSLRLGKQLTYCYTMNQQQPLPEFLSGLTNNAAKLVWRWSEGRYDWAYPLSVDGHLFSTRDMQAIIDTITFSGPNSLESHLQRFNGIYLPRFGICYQTSRIVNVPLNKVQVEERNRSLNVSTDFLLGQWNQGLQIDHRRLYGCRNTAVHQEFTLHFIPRV